MDGYCGNLALFQINKKKNPLYVKCKSELTQLIVNQLESGYKLAVLNFKVQIKNPLKEFRQIQTEINKLFGLRPHGSNSFEFVKRS